MNQTIEEQFKSYQTLIKNIDFDPYNNITKMMEMVKERITQETDEWLMKWVSRFEQIKYEVGITRYNSAMRDDILLEDLEILQDEMIEEKEKEKELFFENDKDYIDEL